MNKKVLIISSSPRKDGNSETLAAAFAKGAQAAGHQVETIYLREKQVGFCKGCFACLKLGHCVIQDDAVEIAAQMHDANVLVFATPVYYYCVSGQLKTMLDRANPLFDTDYAFTKAYLLATAGREHTGNLCGHRESRAGLGRLLPLLCAGGHSVCRRRKRRGRDRRSYCAGASLSDGQGCLNKHFRYEEHILSQQE